VGHDHAVVSIGLDRYSLAQTGAPRSEAADNAQVRRPWRPT